MTIWVKELLGTLTAKSVSMLVLKSIAVQPFTSIEEVKLCDVIVISKQDVVSKLDFLQYNTMVYEDFSQRIYANIISEYQYNYDYYYLKNALICAKNPNINTIITGSSYGLLGIDASMLTKEVNLSLLSQDLFYSLIGIYEVCKTNSNIKNIVLCCGYYYFYSDLSKTQNEGEILRISQVYEPIYHDIHNCALLPPRQALLFNSNLFDIQNIVNIYSNSEYKKHYFHSNRTREKLAVREWKNKSKNWNELSEIEKEEAGQRRGEMHNKLERYEGTFIENSMYFNELTTFCTGRNINLLIVVPPVSKYYRNALHRGYKEKFDEILNTAQGIIHLLDLYEDENFVDEDFNDTDHLGDLGAKKMTKIILEMLKEINIDCN